MASIIRARNLLRQISSASPCAKLASFRCPPAVLISLGYVLLLAISACQAPAPKAREAGDPEFRTTPPSRLFFANIRSSSYYRERPAGTDLDVYRFRRFSQTAQRPMLIPVIVEAYLKDEAYLFMRPNDFPDFHSPISIRAYQNQQDTILRLEDRSRSGELNFALAMYERLYEGDTIRVMLRDSSWHELYDLRAERSALFAVMQDYFRLTERN